MRTTHWQGNQSELPQISSNHLHWQACWHPTWELSCSCPSQTRIDPAVAIAVIAYGGCFLCQWSLTGLSLAADAAIALANAGLAIALLYFLTLKQHNFPYRRLFVTFTILLLLSGGIHLIEISTAWHLPTWAAQGLQSSLAAIALASSVWGVSLLSQAFSPKLPPPIPERVNSPGCQRRHWLSNEAHCHSLLHTIFNHTGQLIGLLTPDGTLLEANQTALDFGQLQLAEVQGHFLWATPWWRNSRANPERLQAAIAQAAKGQVVRYEVEIQGSGESYKSIDFSLTPIFNENQQVVYLLFEGHDLSERKQAEAALLASLHAKEVLLKETHHRVKNNLQVICSLLQLQAHSLENAQAQAQFQESQNRIKAMALIHEKLYQSQSLARLNLSNYIQDLAESLVCAYSLNEELISLKTEIDPSITLDLDTAIPCGLIINELVANALQHAFVPNQEGEILIRLLRDEQQRLILTIRDTGKGISVNVDDPRSRSFGLTLVDDLVAQLRGTLAVQQEQGLEFIICLPNS